MYIILILTGRVHFVEYNLVLIWNFWLHSYMLFNIIDAHFVKIGIFICPPQCSNYDTSATNQDINAIFILTDILHFVEYNTALYRTSSY